MTETALSLLIRFGTSTWTYEAAKKRAAPYDKIVGELPGMRAHTVEFVVAASLKL